MSEPCRSKVGVATLRGEIAVQFGPVHVRLARIDGKMTPMESNLIEWWVATPFALV